MKEHDDHGNYTHFEECYIISWVIIHCSTCNTIHSKLQTTEHRVYIGMAGQYKH